MMETTPFHKCNANNKSCSEIVALSLRNVTFIGNKADKAGGIMMISNPYIVEVECDINNEEPTDFSKNGGFAKLKIKKTDKKSLFNTSSCSDWNENDVMTAYLIKNNNLIYNNRLLMVMVISMLHIQKIFLWFLVIIMKSHMNFQLLETMRHILLIF